jgi:DNA-binding SARP family transcriptional activator
VVHVSVRLLGEFGIEVDGRAVPDASLRRRDASALVKRLALAPGRLLHREVLADALWPDAEPNTLANRLHKACHFVRKATGVPTAVVNEGQGIALFPDAQVRVDALDLDAAATDALARADAVAAAEVLGRWGGELLPLDLYEEWTTAPRQRFARRYLELLRLAGRHDEILTLDPTDEVAHLAEMRAYLSAGDRLGALRQFDALEQALAREVGIGPSAEAWEMRATAIRDAAGPSRHSAAPSSKRVSRRSVASSTSPRRSSRVAPSVGA